MKSRSLLTILLLATLAPISLPASRISSAQSGNIFTPDAPLVFTFEPDAATPAAQSVVATLRDFENRVIATSELKDNIATLPAAPSGFYRLEIGAANAPALATTTLGVLPPLVKKSADPSSRYGTIAHLKRMDDSHRDLMLDLIARAGFGWIREGFLWHELEPAPGEWRTDRYDDLVNRSLRHGLQVLPVLAFGNTWAAEAPDTTPRNILRQTMPKLDAWETYVRTMITRYGDRLHAWEVWNEPNLPTYWKPAPDAEAYARLAARTFATIKALAPADTVITAGFSPEKVNRPDLPDHDEGTFLRALEAQPVRPYDAVGYHPYTVFRHGVSPAQTATLFKRNFDSLDAGLDQSTRMPAPVWITEIGVSTIPRITTEEKAAGHLAIVLTLALARSDVEKIFLYNFRDVGTNSLEKEDMFGLIHNDYTPKPGYFACHTFFTRFADATFVERTETSGVVSHAFATPDGRTLLALWSANGQPRTADVPVPAAAATRINIVGDATPLAVSNGKVTLEVSAIPIYLEFIAQ
ncbi:MAG: hypothetical protein WC205_18480 [Opitutaceae bacterium]|jgi:hypothetical protein